MSGDYGRGYRQALADIAQQMRQGGDQAAHEWIANNLPRGYHPGDVVYRWWYAYPDRPDMQRLTVRRVNRVALLVETDEGSQFRLPIADVAGYWEG